MNREKLIAELSRDEGRHPNIYRDTVGKWTVGVGRNLSDRAFLPNEIDLMLSNDIDIVVADLDRALPWWREMDDVRQNVLLNMCFNLGITRLLGFKNALSFMKAGRYDAAGHAMLQSKWADQVGARALRLAKAMRTGIST